jgi:type IV secretion system protein VirD4
VLVIQAFSQLREIYGQQNAETMMKSLAVRIVYAPKDVAEATEISQELGFTTVKAHTHSRPLLNLADSKSQRRSVSVSEQKRPLLLPQEVKELGKNREILFLEGVRPILAHKNRYYRDPVFRRRLFSPPTSAVPLARRVSKRPVVPTDCLAKPNPAVPPENAIAEGPIAELAPNKTDSPVTEEVVIQVPPPAEPATREATIADIDRIDSITLEDFAANLKRVKLPESPMSDADTARAVANLLDALRGR